MSSSYHNVKIANSVREFGFHKSSYYSKSDTLPGKIVIEKRIKTEFTLPLLDENTLPPNPKYRYPPSIPAHSLPPRDLTVPMYEIATDY